MLEPTVSKLQKYALYETCSHFYLVGCNKYDGLYRILKIKRTENSTCLREIVVEDPHKYSKEEVDDVLNMISNGNGTTGGLVKVTKAYGIVGFVRFLNNYYMTLITERKKVGHVAGCSIYTIKRTETYYLVPKPEEPKNNITYWWSKINKQFTQSQTDVAESRYQSLFHFVDLTKDFYYSYMYDLTNTIQYNTKLSEFGSYPPPPPKEMYCWNKYQTDEFEACIGDTSSIFWVLPIIHGGFAHSRFILPNGGGALIDLILIGRRSRYYAGTRYLKRGISDQGKVANDVEIEQIVQVAGCDAASAQTKSCYRYAGLVQMRGSIPVHWTQESSLALPKPPIILYKVDASYSDEKLHYSDLLSRYSSPIIVLDLVKQVENRPRESIIGRELWRSVEAINDSLPDRHKIRYCALDFSRCSHSKKVSVLSELDRLAIWSIYETSFFCSNAVRQIDIQGNVINLDENDKKKGSKSPCMYQSGVLRTNCVDCLDRTNVAQFAVGVRFLAMSLTCLGVMTGSDLPPEHAMVHVLMHQYTELGDLLAMQYGGSEAHKKVPTSSDAVTVSGSTPGSSNSKPSEFLTSIRRYYSNAFTDRVKQDAINLFLGNFCPIPGRVNLWDFETDYFLHNFSSQTPQFVELLKLPSQGRTVSRLKCKLLENLKDASMLEEVEGDEIDDKSAEVKSTPLARYALSFFPDLGSSVASRLTDMDNSVDVPFHMASPSFSSKMDDELVLDVNKQENIRKKRRIKKEFYSELLLESESEWWIGGINKHDMSHFCMRLQAPDTDRAPSFFHRVHKPYKLTSFDDEFQKSFVKPIIVDPFLQTQLAAVNDSKVPSSSIGFLASFMSWGAEKSQSPCRDEDELSEATDRLDHIVEVSRRPVLIGGKLTLPDTDLSKILLEIAIVEGAVINSTASENEFQMKLRKKFWRKRAGTIHNSDWWSDFLPLIHEFDQHRQMENFKSSKGSHHLADQHPSHSKIDKQKSRSHGSVWSSGADFISHLFSPFSSGFSPFSTADKKVPLDVEEDADSDDDSNSEEGSDHSSQCESSCDDSGNDDDWHIISKTDETISDLAKVKEVDYFPVPKVEESEEIDVPLGGFTQEFLSSPAIWKMSHNNKITNVPIQAVDAKKISQERGMLPIAQYVRHWGKRAKNILSPNRAKSIDLLDKVDGDRKASSAVVDTDNLTFFGDSCLVSRSNAPPLASSMEFIAWETARLIYRYVEFQLSPDIACKLGHIVRGNDLEEDSVDDLSSLDEIKWLLRELTIDENDGYGMTILGEANGIMDVVSRGPFSGLRRHSNAVDAWKAVFTCIDKEQKIKRYDKLDSKLYDGGKSLTSGELLIDVIKPSQYDLSKGELESIVIDSKLNRNLKNIDEQELDIWKEFDLDYKFDEPQGLCEQVTDMMTQFESEKSFYGQVIKSSRLSRLKSTYTDDADISLYCSYYDDDVLRHDLHEVATITGVARLSNLQLPIAESDFSSKRDALPNDLHSLELGRQNRLFKDTNQDSSACPILDNLRKPSAEFKGFELVGNDLYVAESNEFALFNSIALESFSFV